MRIPTGWRHGLLPLLALSLTLGGCGGGGGTSGSPSPEPLGCGFIPGQITSSVGSSTGHMSITMNFGDSRVMYFNNVNLTFRGGVWNGGSSTATSEIADMGNMCLESITTWPGGTDLPQTVFLGHTYLVRFVTQEGQVIGQPVPPPITSFVGFTADAYSNGVLTFTWIAY